MRRRRVPPSPSPPPSLSPIQAVTSRRLPRLHARCGRRPGPLRRGPSRRGGGAAGARRGSACPTSSRPDSSSSGRVWRHPWTQREIGRKGGDREREREVEGEREIRRDLAADPPHPPTHPSTPVDTNLGILQPIILKQPWAINTRARYLWPHHKSPAQARGTGGRAVRIPMRARGRSRTHTHTHTHTHTSHRPRLPIPPPPFRVQCSPSHRPRQPQAEPRARTGWAAARVSLGTSRQRPGPGGPRICFKFWPLVPVPRRRDPGGPGRPTVGLGP